MFLRNDHGLDLGGSTNAPSLDRVRAPDRPLGMADRLRQRFPDFDLVPDLGSRIGSGEWFRGVATCAALCAVTLAFAPDIGQPIYAASAAPLSGTDWKAARSQSIAPLALGATTGSHMGATDAVRPLADTPERPIIELTALLGSGDRFAKVLRRTGVAEAEADRAAQLVSDAVGLKDLKSGTRLDVTLGRRPARAQPRPLEKLSFRARFDLALEVLRSDGGLRLKRIPIAIDHTPLRIRGRVGASLYRSARAAGAPAKAVEAFIKSIAAKVSMSRIGADDEFDLVIEQARAETGEVQLGKLLYAGLAHGKDDIELARWDDHGRTRWFDADGSSRIEGEMLMPVHGRITSPFGVRTHPILHYKRMHTGLDIAAAYGTPIRAADAGKIVFAGRNGGYGNFVKIRHGHGIATEYGHMSKIAVRSGRHVDRGDVIGYVGSTGLSTGPHLHYEIRRNDRPVNPKSFSYASVDRLHGSDLRTFKARLADYKALPVGGATEEPEQLASR
ncbi:M23 family metallopeptidase [Stakelama saccharophila]|uniref:M23 family metallopeptidase n=1 Tax=Stakelama saccharophila TaxID=3075605 RepID=A0ABZ0BA37_9SPHN|nr:M23 family metallopeptidase [Stakelama sp. W311]WNO54275.1 M23 family metallopeptidase [Stakelama sp. W311]